VNSVQLVGRLAHDPDSRTTATTTVTRIKVAVDGWDSVAKQKKAEFVPVIVFGSDAKFVADWGVKGREVAVTGSLRQNEWADRETGEKRSTWEVIATRVDLLGPKPADPRGSGRREEPDELESMFS